VEYSKITRSDRPSEIQGETGTLVIDHIEQPTRVTLTRLDGSVDVRELDGPENNMVYEAQRFADLVNGRDSGDTATADNARTAMTLRVVDAITAARRYSEA
jgi:scyllo-inositol 2-dehydrogenase (NADP+)